MPAAITALAFIDRDIEEDCVHVAIVVLGELDIRTPFVRRQIRRVDVRNGAAELNALFQQIAKHGENALVNILVLRVIRKKSANFIARQRSPKFFDVRRFARSRQAD